MSCLIGVRFKKTDKAYYFLAKEKDIKISDLVICKMGNGVECGRVVYVKEKFNSSSYILNDKNVFIRKASEKDKEKLQKIKSKNKWASSIFKDKVSEHKLKMKLVDTYYFFDESKIIFYFTAEKRVDFRGLVKDLVKIFKIRIELIQIGVRDEAKILGGMGVCGIPVCCATFLNNFKAVSIKMAKHQGMSLNPGKISGTCGRLMCCLKYEEAGYPYLNLENIENLG